MTPKRKAEIADQAMLRVYFSLKQKPISRRVYFTPQGVVIRFQKHPRNLKQLVLSPSAVEEIRKEMMGKYASQASEAV